MDCKLCNDTGVLGWTKDSDTYEIETCQCQYDELDDELECDCGHGLIDTHLPGCPEGEEDEE